MIGDESDESSDEWVISDHSLKRPESKSLKNMAIKHFSAVLSLALLASVVIAWPSERPEGSNPGLARRLAKMVKVDQEVRSEMFKPSADQSRMPELARRLESVDRENTNQVRQIVKTYGWPTFDLVGKKGANDAWLLVQHADQNPKFQRECLDLMQPLVAKGQVGKQNFAYLTDRVLLAEGKKQIYGTQFTKTPTGNWEPRPMEDPENVDKRRLEMGMNTLAEYRKLIEEMYGKKPPK